MLRSSFEREISNIENYYLTKFSDEGKEKWYICLHNIPLETMQEAEKIMFEKNKQICSLTNFLSYCRKTFKVDNKLLIDYMEDKGFFLNEETYKKCIKYVKRKNIPTWLKNNMEKYKTQYFKELIKGDF